MPSYRGPSKQKRLEWLLNQVRTDRDRLLSESDHTQLTDAPYTRTKKTAWKTYRQALRDLPSTITELNSSKSITVEWPTPPE